MVQTYVTRALDGDLADDITSLLRNVHGSLTDAGQRAYFESAIATLGNHETYTAVRQQMTDASKVLQELEARDTFGLPPDQVDKLVSEANAVQERINTLSLQLDDLRTIK